MGKDCLVNAIVDSDAGMESLSVEGLPAPMWLLDCARARDWHIYRCTVADTEMVTYRLLCVSVLSILYV